jgi:type IV pilus assembly protein PilN
MIYINLLPVREIKRRQQAKKEIFLAGGSFLLFLICLALFAYYQAHTISNLQKQLSDLQTEKQKYTKILNEIKEMKQSSSLTVHILDEVATLTPPNRMWLTGLSQTGSALQLSGMALDNQTVAKYMDDLENSFYIQNVQLSGSSMKNYAERNLKAFSVSCNVGIPTAEKNDENLTKK